MGYKFRLRDVQTDVIQAADLTAYICTPEFATYVIAFRNGNDDDIWHDCKTVVQTEPRKVGNRTHFGHARHGEWFELEGPPSRVARMIARECRDVANETSARLFGDNQ